MGSWDVGPFDNDIAADWCGELDDAPNSEREAIIRRTLSDAVDEPEYLELVGGFEAVAAAAVVAAHQPTGAPVDTAYGPDFMIAGDRLDLAADLVPLANQALDRVIGENSELREVYAAEGELRAWLATLAAVRAQLNGDDS